MSDAALLQPKRIALAALLHLPPEEAETPAPAPLPVDRLLAERDAAHAGAIAEQQARIAALEAELAEAAHRHGAALAECQERALHLFAGLEALMAAELATLAHATAQAVLSAEPALSQATLASLVADAVHGLQRGTLYVPPAALEATRSICPEGWELKARDGLPDGAVEAEAGPALRHQSLAARLSALMDAAQ